MSHPKPPKELWAFVEYCDDLSPLIDCAAEKRAIVKRRTEGYEGKIYRYVLAPKKCKSKKRRRR